MYVYMYACLCVNVTVYRVNVYFFFCVTGRCTGIEFCHEKNLKGVK